MIITTDKVFENLLELNQIAAIELIKTYFNESGKVTYLIIPQKRGSKTRISEQELRSTMTTLFGTNNYLNLTYSIETPTEYSYSFKGANSRSASTDLSFYEGSKKILNIELKAHNPSQASINKDIEKLVTEDCLGAWCHIFENEDSGTVNTMINKLKLALSKFGTPKRPIYFSFLVLKTRKLITRKGKDNDLLNFQPDRILDLVYADHKISSVINSDIRDWHLNHY
jgi:hypothetical protein